MGVHLDVDLDQLHGLVSQIKPVLLELILIDHAIPPSDPAMFGGVEVSGALDEYSASWKHGKEKLDDRLSDVKTLLLSAIATYEQAESSLGGAVAPTAPPPPHGGGGGGW